MRAAGSEEVPAELTQLEGAGLEEKGGLDQNKIHSCRKNNRKFNYNGSLKF